MTRDRESKIVRQVCVKAAAASIKMQGTLDDLMTTAKRMEHFVNTGEIEEK